MICLKVISLLAGVSFSPHAANFVKPLEYTGSQENLNATTLYFCRLVLGVQLVLAGVQVGIFFFPLAHLPGGGKVLERRVSG
jgi:hypothetical protein